MMIQIKPVGGYYKSDANGFLRNNTTAVLQKNYVAPVTELIDIYRSHYDNIQSIYLRGSVASGTAVAFISDIDMFAILKQGKSETYVRWLTVPFQQKIATSFLAKYPFINGLDLAFTHYIPKVHLIDKKLNILLKLHSKCVYGIDYSKDISPIPLSSELYFNQRWFPDDLAIFLDFSFSIENPQNKIREILKVTIRVFFELVMLRAQKYTQSLYYCVESFKKYYPEKSEEAEQCLFWFLNPPKDITTVQKFLAIFGKWMLHQINTNE